MDKHGIGIGNYRRINDEFAQVEPDRVKDFP